MAGALVSCTELPINPSASTCLRAANREGIEDGGLGSTFLLIWSNSRLAAAFASESSFLPSPLHRVAVAGSGRSQTGAYFRPARLSGHSAVPGPPGPLAS